jgi:acetyl esterase/lipase
MPGKQVMDFKSISLERVQTEPKTQSKISASYKSVNGQQLELAVDLTAKSTAPTPVILYVHSWSGDLSLLKPYSTRLTEQGVAGVRINYRKLSEGHTFEQSISDVRDALQWIRDHAEEYGFDMQRLGIAGASAGGLLSSLVTLENPDCRVYIGFNGGYDLVDRDGSKWPPEERMETLLAEKNTKEARGKWSAVHQIPEKPTRTAFLLLHGTADETITFSVAQRYADALKEKGNSVELISFEGEGHGFFGASRQYFQQVYYAVKNHVVSHLTHTS